MTATQLPKPGDRFRWVSEGSQRTVVAVTEHNVFYEFGKGVAGSTGIWGWLKDAIPIPPKPHAEPVQWGWVHSGGSCVFSSSEGTARATVNNYSGSLALAKLDHGVLFVEQGGEFVRAFEGGAG